MLEKVAPKRCGQTGVKEVVDRDTDCRGTGALPARALEEALWRLKVFAELLFFLRPPQRDGDAAKFCLEC